MSDRRRRELGDFLRSRRERLTPKAARLPAGRRRRTPGLRREEVAELAGIGVDWYVRLEQGRDVAPSMTMVAALARALRLNPAEAAHLRALAGGGPARPFRREAVPAPLRHFVTSISQPAYVTGQRWDVLAWNGAAAALFTDFAGLPEAERNILVWLLTTAEARARFGDGWAAEARRVVARFRASHDLWAGDPAFRDLLDRLTAGCAEFRGWWEAHEILAAGSGLKRLRHPEHGPASYQHAGFQANDDPRLRLVVFTPVPDGG